MNDNEFLDSLYLAKRVLFIKSKLNRDRICRFIKENNKIEGIKKKITPDDVDIVMNFLFLEKVSVLSLITIVKHFESSAELRIKDGVNVTISLHKPPQGGGVVAKKLRLLLSKYFRVSKDTTFNHEDAYILHCDYEALHPFTDCNGRSGRILWLWLFFNSTGSLPRLDFLHLFYYHALSHYRKL